MEIIAVLNQKGGVGKTTTAGALAAGLSMKGYSVLSIDMDAQANTTYTTGAKTDGATILGVLVREVDAVDAIQHTEAGDIIPASKSLAGADVSIVETGKEYRLKEALEKMGDKYQYVIIDTPPALGILTVNALTACHKVIIPAQADIFSLQGVDRLAETIEPVRKYCNPSLSIDGILLTRYSNRSVLSRELFDLAGQMAANLGTRLYKATIREAVAIREAQIRRKSIFEYAPKSKVAEDYQAFVDEFLGGAE